MGILDEPLAEIIETVIDELVDNPTTISRPGTVYDEATGEETIDPTQAVSVSVKVSPPSPYSAGEIDGTNIRAGDARVIVAADALGSFVPDPQTDSIVVFGENYRIVRSDPIAGGDSVVAYALQLRR